MRVDLVRANPKDTEVQTNEQLWAQCDSCTKWRRLPESMRDSDELDEAWTCAMHPDPAWRECEVAEEGLGEGEVTTQVAVEEGSCGTPGCKYADFHFGPCSCWEAASGGERKRRQSSLGEEMATLARASSKTAKTAKAAKALQQQAQEQSGTSGEHSTAQPPHTNMPAPHAEASPEENKPSTAILMPSVSTSASETTAVMVQNPLRSKMRAPSAPAPRSPCSKKAPRINSYAEFCREQRPLLPTSLRNAERERVLGQRWRTLSEFERANWRSSVPAPDSSPAPAPTAVLGAAPTFSTDLGTAAPSTPVVAAPVPARATPPSVVDARAQAPTTVHAPAAPNSPAARVASANNRLMMLLSEADNDTVMELMHAEEYFQSSTPVCAKAPPQA